MGALAALIFLTTLGLIKSQLIVPQDIAIGQQQGTLSGLTQFGNKDSDVINSLSSPQEILVESLSASNHESQKSNTIHKKFPVAPTSDLLGVADIPKPKEVSYQGKPPDRINKDTLAPLPLGVDFLSTSISSQEIIDMPRRGEKKGKGPATSRSWKNLVQSNPRQVGDRFDIVIEKRINGNELSPGAKKKSKSSENRPIQDVPVDNARSFLHEPELPWLNAAVELTPEHTWRENTIVRSSIGPMEMAEISTNAVKVRKAKIKSNANKIMKTTSSNVFDVNSTPNPVDAMNSNPETHVTRSFHLKTANKKVKKPVTPSTVGWTSWVEPVATETSPSWFEGQETIPNMANDKLISGSDVNSLHSKTEVKPTKETKTTPKLLPAIKELPVELPKINDIQNPKSKGFFASWRPWTGTPEQTTVADVASTDSGNIGHQETEPVSSVTPPTIMNIDDNAQKDQTGNQELANNDQNRKSSSQGINSDLGNQIDTRELASDVQNRESANQLIHSDLGQQIDNRELDNNLQNIEHVNQGISLDPSDKIVTQNQVDNGQNTENANQDITSDQNNKLVIGELSNNMQNTENANQGINADQGKTTGNLALGNNVQTTESEKQNINSDLNNQLVIEELTNNMQNTENAHQGINANQGKALVDLQLDKNVQTTKSENQDINTDPGNEIVNREQVNSVRNAENANHDINSDLENQIKIRDLVNNVQITENGNQAIISNLGNEIVNRELANNVANATPTKQMLNYANVENIVTTLTGKGTTHPEILIDAITTETARQSVHTEPVKHAVSPVLDEKSSNIEVANLAKSSTVLGSLEMLNSDTLRSDVLMGAKELKQSIPKSPFDTLNTVQKKTDLSSSTTIENVKGRIADKAEEVTLPPTSNFDPLLLPPAISAGASRGFQQGQIGQSSNLRFESMGISSNTVLDHNELTGSIHSLGRSGLSHPKRRFFVSPSPSDLIPPQEHLHEGILYPIEPDIPSAMLEEKQSTSQTFANDKEKLNQGTFNSHLNKGHVDMADSATRNEDITSEKVIPNTTSNSQDKMHSTHTINPGMNANSNWNTKSEIQDTNTAKLVRADQLASSTGEAKERNLLLEQIREALLNLNGASAIMKPLDGMHPLSNEPGLTHALIGSVNDFVDIPKTSVGHTDVAMTDNQRTGAKTDEHENQHHHSLENNKEKNLFNDHNSFHKVHSLTDLSGHIKLDEKAIRKKLLSPETGSPFHHFPSHEGHRGHDSFHNDHRGLTDSLSRADVDLSQDLSKSPVLDTPITIRNLQRHIEETNRESAKLRFFTNTKKSKNGINHNHSPKPKRKEKRNKPHVMTSSQPPTTTPIPLTKATEENGLLINNNSIFFDPDTNRPVDPFNNVSTDVLQNAHHAWEDAVAKVKTHIDPIPEIAAVVGDKKNAVRVGSISAFRVGAIPPSLNQEPQPPQDPNAAFHFLDPVTNAVVPIAALPDASTNNNDHAPNPHLPHGPNINHMFGHALSNGEKPTIPFVNPMPSAGDMNSEDGFFVGPILFGPVEDPPPNGDIEISGPVLAMGLSPGDDKNGEHGPQGIDVKKILEGIFKNDDQKRKNQKKTFNSHLSPFAGSSNHTASNSKHNVNRSKPKAIKPISLGREINPLQQLLGGSKQTRTIPHLPGDSGLRPTQTFVVPSRQPTNTQPRKGIPKALWTALAKIIKANKRKAFLSKQTKQNVSTSFKPPFPSTVRKNNIVQRPAQMRSSKPNKVDIQKLINIVKARRKLFGLQKKLTAPQTLNKQHTITGISKSPLAGRSQIPNTSVIKPIALTNSKHTQKQRSSTPTSTNSERLEHMRNKRYQLLLHLMKTRRFKPNHMMTNVPNLRSNLRSAHINSASRPAQRATDRHRFIPNLNSGHSVVRPIPLPAVHQWPFSAPVANQQIPVMNNQHFLPRQRVWPQNQIHYITNHVFV